ncbi:hypothetical protein [Accumulibacter sp.]|uniref:LytS/YhcK type 5TM receptor domain-containing protein n=1 Tax=Accumulibacter sp. TaxID=2053492 RepID=UPI00262F2676|nr:hypothetical protein [Accumulibacter sp.]
MKNTLPVLKTLAVALPFGLTAFLCVFGSLTLQTPGTEMILDPREIFVVLGAALTGPLGALLIGTLAGIYDPVPDVYPVTIAMHVAGALWMAFAYKKLVFENITSWLLFPAWSGLVAVYYFVILLPVMVFGSSLSPELFAHLFPDNTPPQALLAFYGLAWPEFILTSVTTTAILALLPKRLRKPRW